MWVNLRKDYITDYFPIKVHPCKQKQFAHLFSFHVKEGGEWIGATEPSPFGGWGGGGLDICYPVKINGLVLWLILLMH